MFRLIFSLRLLLFFFTITFAYYSLKQASIMVSSKGRRILSYGSLLSILASIFDILGHIFFRDSRYYLLTIAFWTIAVLTINCGGFMVVNRIMKVYQGNFKNIILKDQSVAHGIVGTWIIVFIGTPVYIINIAFFSEPDSSWLGAINAFIWLIGFFLLILSAGWNYFSKSRPSDEINEDILVSDDVLVVKTYSRMLNDFITMTNIPAPELAENTIIRYFSLNPILFEGCHIKQDGTINFDPVYKNISRIGDDNKIQDICVIFSGLCQKLYDLFSAITSKEHVQGIYSENFRQIKADYGDSPVLYEILRNLPEGFLEEEKLALLPRGELEAKVKERTKSLERSRNYINNIIKSMSDMLIVVDNDGNIMTINQAVQKVLGYKEEELIGQPFDIILSDKSIGNILINSIDNLNKGSLAQNLEMNLLSKEGNEISILLSSSVLNDENGKFQGNVFIAHNINDRKIMENALKESEEKYRLVVENASDAILVLQDGIVKFFNSKVTDLSGYSREELKSKSFLEFVHPDDREITMERHIKRLKGESAENSHKLKTINKNGDVRWVETNVILINWEGKPATLNFLDDITEKQKMEEGLTRIQKLESVGILAGGIAHDFNNILTGIMGNISFAKTLIDSQNDAFTRLDKAEKATIRAQNLTQQLLTFSKGGKPILKLTNMHKLLEESVSFAIRGAKANCKYEIQDDLWNVIADSGQISQVISNLVINAEQAMPEGGTIKITAENAFFDDKNPFFLKADKYVKISVEDQGIGISEENLSKIFDPYFTNKQSGSGLGLTIAYSIIEKHEGHISAESQEGLGTKFHFYLPASSEKIIEPPQKIVESQDQGKGRILVMDDEEMIRELAEAMLSGTGYEVSVASDGTEAMELYQKAKQSGQPFDVIIMDLTIPGGMGGKETVNKLIELDPDAKAIVSSGYSDDPVMSNFEKYGFRDVIAKPYKINELNEVVQRVIAG